ncbi:helix-turn-helix domain-containing protein [Fodinicola feengrottensis]|uniref:helix-turn-helix domain-containing protein n=1 Tax=Fodinicola feengrottensis TaxID=435914 RepID=UPI002441673E|nr:helix-turn-helix transcriptional regulator [Fodinicola feengrottensis]
MIGSQLRELRTRRGLSLRELAAQAGVVSATLLSQVERGVTEPSLTTLRRLADVFGESVASLFEDDQAPAVWVSRPGERSSLMGPRGKVRYERLTPGNGQLEVLGESWCQAR